MDRDYWIHIRNDYCIFHNEVDLMKGSRTQTISLEEMNAFLIEAQGFSRITPERGYEITYERPTQYDPNIVVRIYSTVDERTGYSRSSGSDAIRTILKQKEGKVLKKYSRVNRTRNWRANLLKRYEDDLYD